MYIKKMKDPYNSFRNRRIFLLFAVCMASIIFAACSRKETSSPSFPLYVAKQGPGQENATNPPSRLSVEDISFTSLTVEDGLSQSTIGCIFQDSRGFLWFCTYEGADRFDGYEFINYSHDPKNANSIRDNVVYAIAEDQNGNLWFGTQSGLDRYDPEKGEFHHISLDFDEAVVITSLLVDRSGDLWVGARQGAFHIDIENDQVIQNTHFDLLDIEGQIVVSNVVGTIFQDTQGVIWAGTKQGLGRYDPRTDTFVWTLVGPWMAESLVTQAIIEIEPGVLLLGGGYGLIRYDTRTNAAVSIKSEVIIPPSSRITFNLVWSITQDNAGNIWIGTSIGLVRMEHGFESSEFVPQIQEISGNLETVISVFQDQEGNIWVGTINQGLFLHRPLQRKFTPPDSYIWDVLQEGNVNALYEDQRGFLWVGMDQELLRIDRAYREIKHYQYLTSQPKNVIYNQVRAIIEDATGTLWIGTDSGHIYLYDREHDDFRRVFEDTVLSGYPIHLFYLDQAGDIWIGTQQGLYWYQSDRDSLRHFMSEPPNLDIIGPDNINAIQEDANGNLWVATWDGLHLFEKDTLQFSKSYFTASGDPTSVDKAIFTIHPDPAGGLWLGGKSGGLHYFEVSTGKLTHYRDPDGVMNGVILAILADNLGNLWLSSNRGLSKFDPKLGLFTNYAHEDGLPFNEFYQGVYFKNGDGEIFFGGIDGMISFYPDQIPQNSYLPPIAITEITQNGEPIDSDTPINHLEDLALSWPHNYFEFEYAAISYTRPEKNQYAYYLEGIDPDWVYAGKNRTGRYVDLPGGTYTLHLIGSNSDGIWNTEGKKIQITIVPPIWQRLWFQSAVAVGIVAVALAGYRYRVRRIISHSNELEVLVDERTADLSRINEQLVNEIREREKAEHRLAQRIAAEAVLSERNRLARDLHDAVTQTIFSASILSEALPHTLKANPDKGRQQIEELQQLTRGALAELRSLLFELRPEGLVKTDIKELLVQLGKGIIGRSGIPVEIDCDTRVDIPSEVKITLYRIAQEALNNASRHADASHIKILCRGNQELIRLSVQDDGKGFNYHEKIESRMGMGIMQERAADIGASLEVKSQPGGGTTILVEWLFPQNGVSDE